MTIKLSSKGGVGIPRLAPDLTFPGDRAFSSDNYKRSTLIDASSGLTTILSLTGKFEVGLLNLSSLTAENNTCKLTVDGEVIWNDTYLVASTDLLFSSLISRQEFMSCNESLLLEYQTETDTSITFTYSARPIL